jgi:hypothetical protein
MAAASGADQEAGVGANRLSLHSKSIMMKTGVKNLFLGLGLAGCVTFFGACDGGYVGESTVVVDTDYYGPAYGGSIGYGHPYYRDDSHVASPPRRDFHADDRSRAPAHENHSAPAQADHDHK